MYCLMFIKAVQSVLPCLTARGHVIESLTVSQNNPISNLIKVLKALAFGC